MTRLQAIWQIINHTPTWVWFVFAELLFVGIKALKARTVHIAQLFILPAIFLALSLHELFTAPALSLTIIGIFISSAIVGISAGWTMAQGFKFIVDKKNWRIYIPGSALTLILVMTIFGAKYYFGYTAAAHPEVTHTLAYKVIKFAFSGGWTGIALGRLALCMHRVKQATSE